MTGSNRSMKARLGKTVAIVTKQSPQMQLTFLRVVAFVSAATLLWRESDRFTPAWGVKGPSGSVPSAEELAGPLHREALLRTNMNATQVSQVSVHNAVEAASDMEREVAEKISTMVPEENLLPSRGDWQTAGRASFCNDILRDPKPFNKTCKRDMNTMQCKDDGQTLMFSQFKQDFYLYTTHFAKLKRRGVYADVAANHPVSISNTFFMDRCLGWRGICVEANPIYFEEIHRRRSCHLVPTCVSDSDGKTVEFALHKGAGGIVSDGTHKDLAKWEKQGITVPTMRTRCTTMKESLRRASVPVVDYLSLDVEGHELLVLRGFDWAVTKINVISIEVSSSTLPPIEEFLIEKGYVRHIPLLDERSQQRGLLSEDAIFTHSDVVWGFPE